MKKHFLSTVLLAAISSMAMAQDITSNLEAYVSFDNGNATIDAGAATVAGIVNGATPVDDRHGNPTSAMYFDGGDWIDFGNQTNYQFGFDSFTIACWMKGDGTTTTGGYVIGKRGFIGGSDFVYGLTYNYNGGGQAYGYLRGDNSVPATAPTATVLADEWHHVAMVIDRSNGYSLIYVNGAPISAQPINGALSSFNASGNLYGELMMGRASNGGEFFKGWIDDARIYRRALNQTDLALLQDPLTLTDGLKIDLPFCDGQLVDETGLNNMTGMFDGTYPTLDRNGITDAAKAFSTGSSSFTELPTNLISSTDFTIAIWYYYVGTSQYQSPRLVDISKQVNSVSDAIILYPSTGGSNVPYFGMWNSAGSLQVGMYANGSDASINEWTHLVVTKVGNMYSMYVNGNLSTGTTNNFVPANVARNVSRLGRSAYGTADFLLGSIDDFKVWQRGLNATEVTALFNETDACVPVAPCDVNIPDVNFKSALVNNTAINTNNDGEIQCSEAAAYTQALNVRGLGISDLTGLEAFTNIFAVNVDYNDFTSIDISANVALTELSCAFLNNSIPTIDLSSNTILAGLDLRSSGINSIDLSVQTNLQNAFLDGNNLTSLDVTNNPQLIELGVNDNDITTIDLSQNLNLQVFYCLNNSIGGNLDLSAHASLYYLIVQNNLLTGLNIANGNNSNFTAFNTISNPFLTCIQVDDAAWSTTNWTNVDNIVSFSENCLTVGVDEAESKAFEMFPNPTTGTLHFSEAIAGQLLDVTGKILIQFPNTRTLDLRSLAEGVYLIRSDNGTVNRIVKN